MGTIRNSLFPTDLLDGCCSLARRLFFRVLSRGPMPRHLAFIMDGNRRYGRKHNLGEGEAYLRGFFNLLSILHYCYEMGVRRMTVYAFSIDNFNRRPAEVKLLMDLLKEKTEELARHAGTLNKLGVRIEFLGNLDLLEETLRASVKKVIAATAMNSEIILLVCLAYTSTDEISHAVQASCMQQWARAKDGVVSLVDLERHMYFAGNPEPDVLIRTSGETRLSNFLLWQTAACLLHAPQCLWPEISLRHLVWAVLEYQRSHAYFEKIKKRL